MPNSHPFVQRVNEILQKLELDPSAKNGVDLANEILKLVGILDVKSAEEVFESSLELPNAERYDRWFQPHPIFKSDRACFELAESELLQAKFYWLQKHTRQIIAGGVHFTPNFEDEDFTHNERYKVGIDFFLSTNGKSLQVVLSNRGNLRVVELNKRLNSTQVDIFTKWDGAGSLSTQEALHTTLWESFKLKSVNQKFYDGVANSFNELLQHLKSIDKDDEEAKLFASRLLGRLLFCWFLRKQGIIDESIGYFDAQVLDSTTYYKSSLERLFFLTLNTPVDERDELQKQHQQQLVHLPAEDKQPSLFKIDQKSPYLNGGLFEPHENDWFRDGSLTLPEGFFTNLYNHFDEFNFTTDESSPEYEQIAIDPEMLGRVFESLLATQLDETGQQARKAKGAFYTPREIVSYMCKDSLRSHLYGVNSDDNRYKKAIDDLLDTSDRKWASAGTNSKRDSVPKEYRTQIIDALDNVTIIDPACGSGAFPMGMLQLCLRTYERLEGRFNPYKTKLEIIQNNIFGVDIEPMAVEIARLRAWLSLIVDEENDRDVEPLPNLDFKFVCANSLVPLNQVLGLFSDNTLHQKLIDIRNKYFNARKPHTKKALQIEYYKLTKNGQTTLISDDIRTSQLKSFDPFINTHPAEFFDADQMFGLQNGFDIVIGNPPYVNVFQLTKNKDFDKAQYKELYQTARGAYDLYILFFELGFNLLSDQGILAYITPNKYISAEYAQALRTLIATKASVLSIVDVSKVSVFDAAVYPVVTVFQLGTQDKPLNLGEGTRHEDGTITIETSKNSTIKQDGTDTVEWSSLLNQDFGWISKFDSLPKLTEFATVSASFTVSESYNIVENVIEFESNASNFKKLIISSNVDKYFARWGEKKISYLKHRFTQPIIKSIAALPVSEARKQKLESEKLIIAGMTKKLRVFYDENCEYIPTIPTIIITNFKISPKYLLALLNSTLIDAYYRYKYDSLSLAGGYLRVGVPQISEMPVLTPDDDTLSKIEQAVDSLLDEGKNNSKNVHNKTQLQLIDKLIYEIYGVSPDEIIAIEESVK